MKFLQKINFSTLLFLLFASPAWAQVVTIVTEEYPPYNYQDPGSKKILGMSTEVVQEAFKRAKVDYTIGIYPWARAYQMAQETPNVLIYSIGRNATREHLFKWVDIIAPYDVYLFRLASRPEIAVADIADLKKFKIGAVRDDVRAQYLDKKGVGMDLVSKDGLNAKKLASETIDLFPIDELAMVALYKREGLDPSSVVKVFKLNELSAGLYVAFSQQTDDRLVHKIKTALEQMKSDGTYDKICAKYLK
ncbi:MAG TPA: hypothetical protein DCW29_15915 [Janthinobacterium sp.]|nr:hypothetical protein [Janthinobacterium sp.]